MTNEIEKTFFDTFGIEAKTNQVYGMQLDYHIDDYPQITDHILLELIRIIGKKPFGYLQCENTYSTNLGDIRDMITVEANSLKEGLTREDIAHLAKKSIRLTTENSELRHKLEGLSPKVDDCLGIDCAWCMNVDCPKEKKGKSNE